MCCPINLPWTQSKNLCNRHAWPERKERNEKERKRERGGVIEEGGGVAPCQGGVWGRQWVDVNLLLTQELRLPRVGRERLYHSTDLQLLVIVTWFAFALFLTSWIHRCIPLKCCGCCRAFPRHTRVTLMAAFSSMAACLESYWIWPAICDPSNFVLMNRCVSIN